MPNSDLPPGLEGQGYAAGASSQLRPGPIMQPPVVGALRPDIVPASFSPMDLVTRARNRFLSLFQPTVSMTALPQMPVSNRQPLPLAVYKSRTGELENELDTLERRSTTPSVKDLRMQNALANAR